MLPNSLASTGPYAGLWSHLKSMDYALERVLNSEEPHAQLDKERLSDLAEFLRHGLSRPRDAQGNSLNLLSFTQPSSTDYGAAIDLRKVIEEVPQFKRWKQSAKKGFDEMLQRLIDAVEQQAKPSDRGLFPLSDPQRREEFEILRAILQTLLTDTEAAM